MAIQEPQSVRDIMTSDPAVCTPDTPLLEVAKMMVERDCGEIPVLQDLSSRKIAGVITDRDITCRMVAKGKNPLQFFARDCLSSPVVTARPDMSLQECLQLFERNKVRRLPVVDVNGACIGIIAQADVVKRFTSQSGHMLREVSQPTREPSSVSGPMR